MSLGNHQNKAICINMLWGKHLRTNTSIKNIKTICLGVDTSLSIRKSHKDNAFSFLFVGRSVAKKGLDTIISAAQIVLQNGKNIRLHCIGEGPFLKEFQHEIDRLELRKKFIFYDSRPREFVRQLMLECDAFLLPSKVAHNGDSEGLPIVLMEAQACKLLVLSTYHSGIPELVNHGVNGLLFRRIERRWARNKHDREN